VFKAVGQEGFIPENVFRSGFVRFHTACVNAALDYFAETLSSSHESCKATARCALDMMRCFKEHGLWQGATGPKKISQRSGRVGYTAFFKALSNSKKTKSQSLQGEELSPVETAEVLEALHQSVAVNLYPHCLRFDSFILWLPSIASGCSSN
jgi:hypothetical protein